MNGERLRVGFLMGQSQFGTLRRLTETIAQQFRDAGHTASVYDLLSNDSIDDLQRGFENRAFDLMVAFQGWGLNFFPEGPNLFDRARVPYIAILGDHPMYHAGRLRHLSPRCAVLTLDPEHVDFVREIAPCPVVAGPFAMKDTTDYGERVPLEKRDVPLLFMGTCGDAVSARKELGGGNPSLRAILLETLEEKTARAPIRTRDALAAVLAARGIDSSTLPPLRRARMIEDVDRIARAERRLRYIRAIREAPLTIWGTGWPEDVAAKPNVTLVQEGFPSGAEAAKRARILLNVFHDEFAWFHDRCGLAFGTGTPVLTERTPVFDRYWISEGAAFGFDAPEDVDRAWGALTTADLHTAVGKADAVLEAIPTSIAVDVVSSVRGAIGLAQGPS